VKKIIFTKQSKDYADFVAKDPRFIEIVDKAGNIELEVEDNYFMSLVFSIISQQLSGKVARVISNRVIEHFNHEIYPEVILKEEDDNLRGLGLSYPKIKYLKSLASCVINKEIEFDKIDDMSNQEVIEMLIKVKGIGVWTAQMFLIFSMARMDVFASLDLGLRNGVKKLYQKNDLSIVQIEEISKMWSPYRTIASLYLWKMLD